MRIDIDQVVATDARRRSLEREWDVLRHKQNQLGEKMPKAAKDEKETLRAEMSTIKSRLAEIGVEQTKVDEELQQLMLLVPQIPDALAPIGPDASGNVEVRRIGTTKKKSDFGFAFQDHVEIGERLGIFDFERGVKIAGSRNYVLKGPGAELHEAVLRALARIDQLRDEARFRPWFYAVLLSVHRQRSRVAFWRRFVPFLPMHGSMHSRTHDDDRLHAEPSAAWLASGWPSALDEETRTRAIRVSTALQRLPVEQREAIVLFEVEGFAIDEIAELQRASQSAVKSRLARARQRLREHYQAQCQTEDASERNADVDAKSHTPLWLPRRGAGS
jgi:RNA polymerase sigma factor (sigma-70 family)